jgi:hypothetical protein
VVIQRHGLFGLDAVVTSAFDLILLALGFGQQGDVADQIGQLAVAQCLEFGQNPESPGWCNVAS